MSIQAIRFFHANAFKVQKSEANSQLDLLPGSLTLAALGEKDGTVRKAKQYLRISDRIWNGITVMRIAKEKYRGQSQESRN